MAIVRAHASGTSLNSLSPNTLKVSAKGLLCSSFLQLRGPSPPRGPRNWTHLSSSCPIALLLLLAPFSEFLSGFPCQIEVPQLQSPRRIHVFSPSVPFFQLWALPSQLDLSSSALHFKHRETMLQDRTASIQNNLNGLKTTAP